MEPVRYTLTCDGCGEPFYSQEAFPKPHYCSRCLDVFKAGIKEVWDEVQNNFTSRGNSVVVVFGHFCPSGNKKIKWFDSWQAKLKEWNIIPPT